MDENVLLNLNLDELKGKLFSIIIEELTILHGPLSGPNIRVVVPTMASTAKYDIVHASNMEMESRMLLCCYDPESDPSLPDNFYGESPDFSKY